MPQKITDTAQLSCNQGTMPSNLSVTSQNFSTAEGKYIATEHDKQANVNIKPFGQCKLKPTIGRYLPCLPVPTAWQKTTEKDTINNYKIITEDSFCICNIGGKIEITDKGHSEKHEIL
ncbi:DUF4280 domain-containing protein [Chryseobacterium sp. Mn2064]|uniref:DUF4280 domain-containing protein n=1 Tax=Chryseobacterium sp. Mn2064 TaxID=3395263 RepID=UPI003BD59CDD